MSEPAGSTRGCWMSTALPRRAPRSCTLMTSIPSPCLCSSVPSSPSTWLCTGACLSIMALGSSWPWLSASSLVPSSGGWVTSCEPSLRPQFQHLLCTFQYFGPDILHADITCCLTASSDDIAQSACFVTEAWHSLSVVMWCDYRTSSLNARPVVTQDEHPPSWNVITVFPVL